MLITPTTSHEPVPPSSSASSSFPHNPSETLYATLTAFLSTNASSTLSLEVLPSSHPTILQDGLNLAIPKKALIQCFLIARKTFLSNSADTPSIDLATKVLLLYDPEHLSAANWRKRNITALAVDWTPASKHAQSTWEEDRRMQHQQALHADLTFTTTLLTSPLPKHPKSPTLWSHRHWLISNHLPSVLSSPPPPTSTLPITPPPAPTNLSPISIFIHSELTTILTAASRHRANYHAFHYGRCLISSLPSPRTNCHPQPLMGADLEALVEKVRKWCLAHPRDISGWGFLVWLLRWGVDGEARWRSVVDGNMEKVEEFVQAVGWKGASVEWFLREVGQLRGQVLVEKGKEMTEGIG